jgi:hypothetical protein
MQQCERLRKYNRWRRGDKRLKMPDPKELGELIDGVADRLEVLEREHTEFFDRWHDERRRREALERAIIQHQADVRYATQGAALFGLAWNGGLDVDEFERWWENQAYFEEAQVWLAREAWIAALNRAIEVMPGGSVTDPQWVCDKLRELGGTRGG